MAASVSPASPIKYSHFQLAFEPHDNHVGYGRDSSNDPGTSSDLDSSGRGCRTPEPPPLAIKECLAYDGNLSDAETVRNPSVTQESEPVAVTPSYVLNNTHCQPLTPNSPEEHQSDIGSRCAPTPQAELSQARSIWEAVDLFENEVLSEQEKYYTEDCRKKLGIITGKALFCTACSEQFITLNKNNVFVHPVLRVLLCYRCRTFYGEGVFTKDEEGLDEYCRWCANGGKLLCCDFCSNAFCKTCLRRNLNRSYVKTAEKAGSKWKCCVCDVKPLWDQRADCRLVIEHLARLQKKSRQKVKGTPSIQNTASSVSSEAVVAMVSPKKAELENFMCKVKETFAAFEQMSLKLVGKRNLSRVSRKYSESVSELVQQVKEVERIVLRRGQGRSVRRLDLSDTEETAISKSPAQRIHEQTILADVDGAEVGKDTQAEIEDPGRREAPIVKDVENEDAAESLSSKATSSTESQSILPPNCIFLCPSPRANDESASVLRPDEVSTDAETIVGDSVPRDESLQEIPLVTNETLRLDDQQRRQTLPALHRSQPETQVEHPAPSPFSVPTPIPSKKDEDKIANDQCSGESAASPTQRKNSLESSEESEDDVPAKGNKTVNENEKARKAILVSSSSEEDNTAAVESQTGRQLSSPDLFPSENEEPRVSTVEKKVSVASRVGRFNDPKLKLSCVKLARLPKAVEKKLQTTGFVLASSLRMKYHEDDATPRQTGKSKDNFDKSLGRLIDVTDLLAKKDQDDSDVMSSPPMRCREKKKKKNVRLLLDSSEDSTSEDSHKSEEEREEGTNGTAVQSNLTSANEVARRQMLDSSEEEDESDGTEEQGVADSEDKNSEDEGDDDQQTPDETNGEENGDNNGDEQADNNEEANGGSSSPSNGETDANKSNKRSHLPNIRLSDSDTSDDDESRKRRKKEEKKEPEGASKEEDNSNEEDEDEPKKKLKKKLKIDSDSDFEPSTVKKLTDSKKRKASSSDSEEEQNEEDNKDKTRKRRRRIKQVSEDEDDDGDDSDVQVLQESQSSVKGGRKNIKKIMKDTKLSFQTKSAAKEEEERRKRITDRQKMYNVSFAGPDALTDARIDKIVLDFDPKTKEELVAVHPELVKKLKPHQVEGVKFMWEACFESLERMKTHPGSGCILAHCMGLGKTLQVVTLTHTVMNYEACGIKRVLIICPLVTVLNWVNEFSHWLRGELELDVYELASAKQNFMRQDKVNAWYRRGGILVMGYEMYRNLTNEKAKRIKPKVRAQFQQALVNPGPDLVICDEGHLLKNQTSALSKAVNRIRTFRRIVLTGTPLQNNLKEYHCMVDFVKPKLLGTSREFQNRFANPISNGQCADSTDHDVRVMKRRAHVLHNLLEGCVQRYDYSVLTPFLPPKHEYVVSIKLSDLQAKIYSYYLQNCARGGPNSGTGKGSGLFADFQVLARVWTHPVALKIAQEKADYRAANSPSDSEGSINEFINDNTDNEDEDEVMCLDDDDDAPAKKVEPVDWKTRTRRARGDAPPPEDELKSLKPVIDHSTWWSSMVTEEDFKNVELSGKLVVMMDILRECELIGDKILIFSQSIVSLDLIEEFLAAEGQKNEEARLEDSDGHFLGTWRRDVDYFRFDGSTAAELRKTWVNAFNKESNHRARLFLISTRAGGLGINLTSANRVIIFDASWNPSHDVQSIFRIYRFGQTKPCYVYRFLAQGTMEEKIYNRQVTKQSLACRVVDEQQIERHFKASDLAELYQFDPTSTENRPIPNVPKDRLLAELTMRQKEWIVTFHEHDSLLQNKEGESLTEEERKAAWEDYENEKKGIMNTVQNSLGMGMVPNLQAHLVSVARTLTEQNPGISQEDLQMRLGRYVDQLKAMNMLPMMQPQFNQPTATSGVAVSGAGPVTQDQAATAQMVADRQRAMYNLMMANQIANLGGVNPANMGMPTQARRGRPPLPPSQSHFYPQLTTNYLMQNLAAQVANQQLPTGAIPNLNSQGAIPGSRPASSNANTAAQPKPGSSKEAN